MKTSTLFRELLDLCPEPHFEVARELKTSASSLSRHAAGLLNRKSVLSRAADFFTQKTGVQVTPDLLRQPITIEALVAAAKQGSNVR